MKIREEWRPVIGFIGYEISSMGRVRSYWRRRGVPGAKFNKWKWEISDKPKFLKSPCDAAGYPTVGLSRNGKQIRKKLHVLLLEAFTGPRPTGMWGCHRDDNPTNYRLENLYWATPVRNGIDRMKNSGGPKLQSEDVITIRGLLATGMTQTAVAKLYDMAPSTISNIHTGKLWYWV